MADFKRKRKVETEVPEVKVDAGLPVGKHLFRLTVVDSSGNRSKPASIVVNIFRSPVRPGPFEPGPIGPIVVGPIGPIRRGPVN